MPTFIQEAETAWNTTTTPKTTPAFDALAGDVIVLVSMHAADGNTTLSNNGTAITWTLAQTAGNVAFFCLTSVWSTVLTEDRPGLTVTFARSGTTRNFGGSALTIRDANGIGASAKAHVDSAGGPTLDLVTTEDNSLVVVATADWDAVTGARTWREGAGTLTELTYSTTTYTLYLGYHADVGTAGTKTVGLSAPTGQSYAIVAVEVTPAIPPPLPEQTDLITLTSAE